MDPFYLAIIIFVVASCNFAVGYWVGLSVARSRIARMLSDR